MGSIKHGDSGNDARLELPNGVANLINRNEVEDLGLVALDQKLGADRNEISDLSKGNDLTGLSRPQRGRRLEYHATVLVQMMGVGAIPS